jgi:hypothetical protein
MGLDGPFWNASLGYCIVSLQHAARLRERPSGSSYCVPRR